MTEQYRVWCPDLGENEDDCKLYKSFDHEGAAKDFVRESYHDEPFEQCMEVMVRCTFGGDNGELKSFSVHPEPTISFYAYETTP